MARSKPSTKPSRKPIVIGLAAVVVIAAGVFAWGRLVGPQTEADRILAEVRDTPEEQRFEAMHKIREQSRNLSEEDRKRLHEGMRDMFMEEVTRHIDEYENAPEDQKQEILDRQIDDMVERMNAWREEMEKRRAEREAAGDSDRGDRAARGGDGGPGGGPPEGGARAGGDGVGGREGRRGPGGRRGGRWGGRTVQERKERMEGGNPDARARMIRHMIRMRERAAERGIDMGRGMGGGRRGG